MSHSHQPIRLIVTASVLIAALVGLAGVFPATWFIGFIVPTPPGVTIKGVHGSIWRGHARQLSIHHTPLGHVSWDVAPASLWHQHPAYDIAVAGPTTQITAQVSIQNQAVNITALQGHMGVPTALSVVQAPMMLASLNGTITVDIASLTLAGHGIKAIKGHVVLKNMRIWTGETLALGSYQIAFTPGQTGLGGHVRDIAGPIWLRAHLITLPDGRVSLMGRMRARAAADPRIKQALRRFGTVDAHGLTHFATTPHRLEATGRFNSNSE